jgi:hypothetical protein
MTAPPLPGVLASLAPAHPRRSRPGPRRPGQAASLTHAAACNSVRFLVRYFQTRTLTPFAIYCLALGALSVARFAF